MIHRPSRNGRRGQVLLLTAFFVFVLFTLAFAYFKLVPGELNSALRSRQAVAGEVATQAGFRDALAWLKAQPASDVLPQARLDADYNQAYETAPAALNSHWSYRVKITARPDSPYLYDVTSVALFDGRVARESLATVTRSSFARYALFIDTWREDLIFAMKPGAIAGPFHTNGFFRLGVPGASFYESGEPPFVFGPYAYMSQARLTEEGALDFPGDGSAYYDNTGQFNHDASMVPYDVNGGIDSRYRSIVEGGRANYQVTGHIDLPDSANQLYQQAVKMPEGSPPFVLPTEDGFVVTGDSTRVSGGLYIKGDVEIELALSPEGNQIHRLRQVIPEHAYSVEREVNRPIPLFEEVYIPPTPGATVTVPEYERRLVQVTRQQIVDYRDVTQTRTVRRQTGTRLELVGGITTSVPVYTDVTETYTERVPVYGEVTVEEMQMVPTGNMITIADEGRTVSQPTGEFRDNFVTETEIVSTEEYEANPDAYPGAQSILLPGGLKTGQVIEVTSEEGFQGLGVTAPKGSTVICDYDGKVVVKQGNLNGVTFVDGNVTSLKGVSKGALSQVDPNRESFVGRYIVANPQSGRKLTLDGNLLQYYGGTDAELRDPETPMALRRGRLSPNGQHAMGIVAETVRLKPPRGHGVQHLYGSVLAGRTLVGPDGKPLLDEDGRPKVKGGFGTDESLLSGAGLGEFRLYGGLVEANADLWNSDGSGLTGELIYDPAVAQALPNFPRSSDILTLRYHDRYADDL